jgi:hypothetical protein
MRFLKSLFGAKTPQNDAVHAKTIAAPKSTPKNPPPVDLTASRNPGPHVASAVNGFPFQVVGESNYQPALESIAGGYRRESQGLEVLASIVLDPKNKFDPNAVRVEIEGQTVGFLPAAEAKRVGGLMNDQGVSSALVVAEIRGGWRTNQHDQGFFGVCLKMPKSGWIDFGVGAEQPAPPPKPPRTAAKSTTPKPNATGPLSGTSIVLWGFPRDGDVAQELAAAGAKIMSGPGKTTSMVVMEDGPLTPGMRRSSTYVRIEELRAEGKTIDFITLTDIRARIASGTDGK